MTVLCLHSQISPELRDQLVAHVESFTPHQVSTKFYMDFFLTICLQFLGF